MSKIVDRHAKFNAYFLIGWYYITLLRRAVISLSLYSVNCLFYALVEGSSLIREFSLSKEFLSLDLFVRDNDFLLVSFDSFQSDKYFC